MTLTAGVRTSAVGMIFCSPQTIPPNTKWVPGDYPLYFIFMFNAGHERKETQKKIGANIPQT
jgi:hypothetical protein